MHAILKIMTKNKGYARLEEFKKERVHSRIIAKAISDGIINKVKPGLYKLVDYPWDEHSSFVDICLANNLAVLCLVSASEYYGLTTYTPPIVSIALPHNSINFKINYPPVKVYYFSETQYKTGLDEIKTNSGTIKVYNQEKTVVDLFRYKNKIGEDIFIESLKNYLNNSNRDINKLIEYSTILKVSKKILPYIKAITG
jgi:predicted transcriptional regulator of viral defense system